MKQELRITRSVPRQLALIALCIFLAGLGVYILYTGGSVALGIVDAVFFAACAAVFIWQMFLPAPLVLGPEGFTDSSSSAGAGFVAWRDVKSIFIRKLAGQTFVSVEPADTEAFLSALHPAKREVVRANIAAGFPAINITLQATGKKPGQVCAIMQEYRDAWEAAAGAGISKEAGGKSCSGREEDLSQGSPPGIDNPPENG